MYCPECFREYGESSRHCSECRVPLEHGEPPADDERPDPDLELVAVRECHNPAELGLAKTWLEDAGIPYLVRSLAVEFGAGPGYANPLLHPPSRILVPRVNEKEARALLEPLSDMDGGAE